jgi:hypothetical protein
LSKSLKNLQLISGKTITVKTIQFPVAVMPLSWFNDCHTSHKGQSK